MDLTLQEFQKQTNKMSYAKKILSDKIHELYAEKERIEKLGAFADQLALAVLFQKINELKKAFFKI